MAVLDIERMLASKLNMLIPIGVIIGAPFFGWLPDRLALDKSRVLTAITAVYSLCWLAILPAFDWLAMRGFAVILLLMGLMIGGFISAIWGIIRETTPTERLGMASGLLNPAPFLGVAAFQVITGSIIDRAGQAGERVPLSGFTTAFGVCLAAALVCLALSFFIRARPTPKNRMPM
jgi:MFS family permease